MVIPKEIDKYSYLRSINAFASQNNLLKLYEAALPGDDLELRIQVGFGLYGEDALILQRTSGEWQATHYRGMICHYEKRGKIMLSPPQSGWEAAWQKLQEAGILSLSGINRAGINDGVVYICEINMNGTYSVYVFENPDYLKEQEGNRMVEIGEILALEFGLNTFKVDYDCK